MGKCLGCPTVVTLPAQHHTWHCLSNHKCQSWLFSCRLPELKQSGYLASRESTPSSLDKLYWSTRVMDWTQRPWRQLTPQVAKEQVPYPGKYWCEVPLEGFGLKQDHIQFLCDSGKYSWEDVARGHNCPWFLNGAGSLPTYHQEPINHTLWVPDITELQTNCVLLIRIPCSSTKSNQCSRRDRSFT